MLGPPAPVRSGMRRRIGIVRIARRATKGASQQGASGRGCGHGWRDKARPPSARRTRALPWAGCSCAPTYASGTWLGEVPAMRAAQTSHVGWAAPTTCPSISASASASAWGSVLPSRAGRSSRRSTRAEATADAGAATCRSRVDATSARLLGTSRTSAVKVSPSPPSSTASRPRSILANRPRPGAGARPRPAGDDGAGRTTLGVAWLGGCRSGPPERRSPGRPSGLAAATGPQAARPPDRARPARRAHRPCGRSTPSAASRGSRRPRPLGPRRCRRAWPWPGARSCAPRAASARSHPRPARADRPAW